MKARIETINKMKARIELYKKVNDPEMNELWQAVEKLPEEKWGEEMINRQVRMEVNGWKMIVNQSGGLVASTNALRK